MRTELNVFVAAITLGSLGLRDGHTTRVALRKEKSAIPEQLQLQILPLRIELNLRNIGLKIL